VTSSALEALETVPAPEWEQPDQRVERAEQTSRLREALLHLPERQRMALLLRLEEGLSYAEIASVMDCSRSSVESLLFRARTALDKALRK
jgi:RNA polymerase sigma-70 factor (ECF subfamily)